MRGRYIALLVAVLPSLAAAQGPLCRLCVEPAADWPRQYRNAEPASGPARRVTAMDMRQLGLLSAPGMLAQLPSNIPLARQPSFFLDETFVRLRAERDAAQSEPPPLIHETIVAAPLENVWRAWTTSAGLSAWLAPRADIDLRVGGKLRVAYDATTGLFGDTAVENEIMAYDRPRMLAFRVSRPPTNFAHVAAAASMWTVVYLDAVSADTTRVRVVVNGLRDDAEAQDARAFFEHGNADTLRRLEQRFGTPQ